MGIFLVENLASPNTFKTNRLVVAAETAADAKVFAGAHFNGDASWADAVTTALTEDTLDASASMLGYTWNIIIAGGTITDGVQTVSVTGTGTDDLDAIMALLVIELNALADIANAAYAAPALTISSIADALGDAKVTVQVFPPSGNTLANLESIFVASITDEGIAAAALVMNAVADTEARPVVIAEA